MSSGKLLSRRSATLHKTKAISMYRVLNVESPSLIYLLEDGSTAGINWDAEEIIPGLDSPGFVRANNTFEYVDTPNLVTGADNMTCLLFCQIDNVSSEEVILFSTRRSTTPPNGLHYIGIPADVNNALFFWFHDGSVNSSGVNLRDGNTHMLAMVKDATHCRGYVDGVANGTPVARTVSTAYGGVAGAIGNLGPSIGGRGLTGSISCFAYYKNTALSAARILQIWQTASI